jgi:uncharacterized membrane protein
MDSMLSEQSAADSRSRLRRVLTSPWFIFCVALSARLLYLAYSLTDRPPLRGVIPHLGFETGRIARSIAEGRGFSSPLGIETGPTAWITPVYPYLLAGVFKVFGVNTVHSELVIKLFNCVASSLVTFPLSAIGRRIFGAGIGAAAAWYWALNYGGLYFASEWVWDTSLSALILTTLLWMTYTLGGSDVPKSWGAYGGVWALGALTNASLLSVFPGFLGFAAYRARNRGASWLRLAAVSLAVFGAGVSPWLIRNQIVFHHNVLFRSNFGLEFWLGNNPDVPDSWTWWLHPDDSDVERQKYRSLGEVAYMEEKRHLAFQFIESHPRDFARFCYHRFMHTWTGFTDPIRDIWSRVPLRVKAIVAHSYLLSLLALAGLVLTRRAEPLNSFPLIFLMAVFPAVYYVTHTTPRYRHPIDPAMCLLAVCAIALPFRAAAKKKERDRKALRPSPEGALQP